MASLAQINIRFKADLKEFSSQLQNAQRQIAKQGEELKRIGAGISTYVTLPLVAAGTAATKYASDLEQSLQKTEVVFGKQANNIKEFSQTTLEAYGISEGAALTMLSLFGDMATSMGVSQVKAADMSKTIVGLAGDIASFKNIGLDQVQTALTGIFSGETESLKMLGIVMTEANLQQYAYTQGINKKVQAMTQDEKVMLRYNFVLNQSRNAHGDFQREIGSAANQSRVFTEGLKEVGAQFGAVILPYFTKAVTVINGYMKQVMATDSEQKKWIVGLAAVAAAVGPVTVVFGTFMAAVPNIIAGFKGIRTAVLAMNAAFLANPITLTVAALGAFVTAGVLMESRLTSMTNAKREFDEMTKRATSSVGSEVMETRKLLQVAQNKKLSDEERTRALNKLIQKSDEHFGKLTLETVGTDKARKAVDAYTGSLIQNARVKAAQEKLEEVNKRIFDLEEGFSGEADPSIWQTVGNRMKSVWSASGVGFTAEQAKTQAKNTQVVSAELNALKNKLEDIIGPQKEVNQEIGNFTDTTTGAAGSTNSLKKAVEDLGVIGSEKWMQAQITALEEQRSKLDVTSGAYKNLGVQLQVYKNTLESIKDPVKAITEGSEEWYSTQIQQMEEQVSKIDMMSDAYKNLKTQIDVYKKTLELAQAPTAMPDIEPEQNTVDWYNYHIAKLKEAQAQAGITVEEFKRLSGEINILETTFKIQVEGVDTVTQAADQLKTNAENISNAFTSIFGAMTSKLEGGVAVVANIVGKMVPLILKTIAMNKAAAMAEGIKGAVQSGSGTGAAAAFTTPAFLVEMLAIIGSAFASLPKFADGGIVSGPTLGLMGEYAGAANNPEVIAPLNKLKELIQPASTDQPINVILQGGFDVSGENLRLVLNRVDKRKLRTG